MKKIYFIKLFVIPSLILVSIIISILTISIRETYVLESSFMDKSKLVVKINHFERDGNIYLKSSFQEYYSKYIEDIKGIKSTPNSYSIFQKDKRGYPYFVNFFYDFKNKDSLFLKVESFKTPIIINEEANYQIMFPSNFSQPINLLEGNKFAITIPQNFRDFILDFDSLVILYKELYLLDSNEGIINVDDNAITLRLYDSVNKVLENTSYIEITRGEQEYEAFMEIKYGNIN